MTVVCQIKQKVAALEMRLHSKDTAFSNLEHTCMELEADNGSLSDDLHRATHELEMLQHASEVLESS